MDQEINTVPLTENTPQEEGLSLPSAPNNPLPPAVAAERAYKIASGGTLGDISYDDIHTQLTAGEEENLRRQAAMNSDVSKAETKKVQVMKIVSEGKDPSLAQKVLEMHIPKTDEGTVFETAYGAGLVNELDKTSERLGGDTSWAKAGVIVPNYVGEIKHQLSDVAAKREIAVTMKQDNQARIEKLSWGDTFLNIAPTLFQAYNEYKLRGNVPGVSSYKNLLGTNLEEQRKELYREKTPEDFKKRLESIVKPLSESNPYIADMFLSAVVGQTTDEQSVNNMFTAMGIFDLTAAGGLAKSLAKGVKTVAVQAEVNAVAKDIIKSMEGKPTVVNKIAATGDVGEAAVTKVSTNFQQKLKGTSDVIEEALDFLPSTLKLHAEEVRANPGSLTTGLANMLEENFHVAHQDLTNTISRIAKIRRIPLDQATEETLQALKVEIKDLYPGISNSILNIADPFYNPISNTYHYEMQIGNRGGVLFTNPQIAKTFAEVNGLDGKVVKQGLGFYINVTKPLDEASQVMRDLLINPKGRTEQNWKNATLGWLRSPEDAVSFNERVHRKIASYAQGEIRALADSQRQYLQTLKNGGLDELSAGERSFMARKVVNGVNYIGSKLRLNNAKNKWDDLERVLQHNQRMYDPNVEEKVQGYFFKSPGELEQHYLTTFNRLPEFDEVQAYFAHVRLWDYDHAIRNLRVYTNKSRLGVETHTFFTFDKNGNQIVSPAFDGVKRKVLPRNDDLVLIKVDTLGSERIVRASSIDDKLRARIEAQTSKGKIDKSGRVGGNIQAGSKSIIELYAPEDLPFNKFGRIKGDRIRYVVTDNLSSKNISYSQVPRRGGGHFEYDHPYFIKQAVIRPENYNGKFHYWYEGDKTALAISIRAKGADVTKKMNAVRLLLKAEKEVEAKALLEKTLPFEWSEFKGWFTATKDKPSLFDIAEPFKLTKKDVKIHDMDSDLTKRYGEKLRDGTKEGSLSRAYQVKYTGERDADNLRTIVDEGSRGNPVYKLSDADLVDPIPMMNRALSRITNSAFMDDYKISAMERWIQEAAPHLDHLPSELSHAPFYYFNQHKFKPGTPTEIISSLKSTNFKIRQFVGLPNHIQTALHSAAQNLTDATYKALGGFEGEGQAFKRGLALTPSWLLTRVTDPISFIRGMVFHDKLGLFAVPQILVQNMTYVTIAALSPKNVLQGASGAFLHHWSGINPGMVKTLDKYASKLGWRPGEWAEANAEMLKTGFGHVGGEYINIDNLSSFKTVKNAGQDFLDWGQFFFRTGEKNVRYGAWYTAFKEYRRANPYGRITEAARENILERADVLYTNMSRASASILHTGPLSLTTQFLSYQLRLAELFFSKRIGDTRMDRVLARARIAGLYGAMFGVPTATGITGLPLADYLNKEAVKAGYTVGNNVFADLVKNGLPAYFMAFVSGGGNVKKGNLFNFGERYGASGFEFINQVLRGDVPWYRIIGGASQSVIANTLEAMDPLFRFVGNMARDEHKFPLRPEDLITPLSEVQSVGSVKHLLQVYNTGKWFSKKGYDLGETSMAKALFMAATGLQDNTVGEAYLKLDISKEEKDLQKEAMLKAVENLRYSFQANVDKNKSAAEDYYRRAIAILEQNGFPKERYVEVVAKARERFGTLMDDVDYNFYLRNVPETRKTFGITVDENNRGTRYNAYKDTLKLKQEKEK